MPSPTRARPLAAPFAAVVALLVAVEVGYFGWLLWDADRGWGWYLLLPAALLAGAVLAAGMVWRGTGWGSAVLAWACALPLLGLLGLGSLFAVLGTGTAAGVAVLLAVAPLTGLVLSRQRAVREWTRPRRPTRAGPLARLRGAARRAR
ncbi:hypothetical protein [Modestobacter marinus]|uniref:hypothetical protein n=1 Tax=Modestobacter marinus TaxID=477641 RepID=UPI001C96FD70|nr:hypothetical protein [Modestobacter marinus]